MKKILCLFFFLIFVQSKAVANDCRQLIGQWTGTWQAWSVYDDQLAIKSLINAEIDADDSHITVDVTFLNNDTNPRVYLYGDCRNNSLSISGTKVSLRGIAIENEITLIGFGDNENIEFHISKAS